MANHFNESDVINRNVKKAEHVDEKSVDIEHDAKDYPVVEHISNARLMPMTGPYGGLDLLDTYEYGSVPEDPDTPMESYEIVNEKQTGKK